MIDSIAYTTPGFRLIVWLVCFEQQVLRRPHHSFRFPVVHANYYERKSVLHTFVFILGMVPFCSLDSDYVYKTDLLNVAPSYSHPTFESSLVGPKYTAMTLREQ